MSQILHALYHALIHTFWDTLSLIPFLFATYLVMEALEHRAGEKVNRFISTSGKYGPLTGAIIGLVPQCGFSAATASLFGTGVIGGGTLLAVFLSTSDEMLPVMMSHGLPFSEIGTILALKAGVACLFGFIYTAFIKDNKKESIGVLCHEEGCHCEKGILRSAIHHTFSVSLFLFVTLFVFEAVMELVGETALSAIISKTPFVSSILSALFGLIPGCASSVIITELYIEDVISFGTLMSGLLTGSGVGILVLFKTNKNTRENLKIVSALVIVGVITGILCDILLK